jgi:ubiquinone/menaquinone biosynthesis C-methylase UbiE
MKTKSPSSQELREFSLLMGGYAFFQAMYSAHELGVFNYLRKKPGSTRVAMAKALKCSEHGLRVLLFACTAVGLIKRHSKTGRYENSWIALHFLASDSPHSLQPLLEANRHLMYRGLEHLPTSVQQGNNVGLQVFPGKGVTLYERIRGDSKNQRVFYNWMKMLWTSNKFEFVLKTHLQKKMRGKRTLLDVGGGEAESAIQLCRAYPDLKVTVFDFPETCTLARKNIKNAGLGHRIQTVAGNFLKDPFPEGFDAVIFSHIMSIYSEKTNRALIKKSHRALNPGGTLVIYNSAANESETGSVPMAHLSLYFLTIATGHGMIYPIQDFENWFQGLGYRPAQTIRVKNSDHILVTADKK